MDQSSRAVEGPLEPTVGRLDRERADFEAWAAKQWGKEAWRHMSGTSGEWEAYRAGVMAAEAQWERALRLAWNMVDTLQPAGQPGSYARGQDAGIAAALKTVRENLMAARKTPNVGNEGPPKAVPLD
jgi:hypothetical protein